MATQVFDSTQLEKPVKKIVPIQERIVCKFGGTSLADAAQIRKVRSIIEADARRRCIVVSAPGKRHNSDQKVTDLLLTSWHLASQQLDYAQPLNLVRARYNEIADELGVLHVDEPLDEMARELEKLAANDASTLASRDWIAARGEYFHAVLIASFLNATFVPSGECVLFGEEGALDPVSYENLASRMAGDGLYVVPGFYGRDKVGRIKTFPRGGSDITGAVVARAIHALIYENWSDVSGMLMADPRIIENPRPMQEVTYREVRELAYMGASVFQEDAIFPAAEAGIPIHIKNTNAPADAGTRIVTQRDSSQSTIAGIAGRTGFTAIYLEKAMMNQQRGFGRRVLEVLEAHDISWEHMPSAIDSMSIIISNDQLEGHEASVLKELGRVLQPDRVESIGELALIATVGEGMAYRVGVAGRLFSALKNSKVNVRMISQGASEINIIVGVAATDYENAVRAIYNEFADS
jgi:aspartate kinase